MTRNRIIQNNEKVNHHWLERLDIDIKMDYNKKKHRCGVRKMGIPTNIRTLLSGRVNHQAELEDLNITLIQQYLREVDSGLYPGRWILRSCAAV